MTRRMRYTPSDADIADMRRMWADLSIPLETIMRRMRTSLPCLHALAERLGLPPRGKMKRKPPVRPAAVAATLRRACLGCGKDFPSAHKFHRVCDNCKSSEDWRAGLVVAHDGGQWLGRKAGAP